jgi:hypothetical protein
MRAIFEILPGDIDTHKCILVCEVSAEGFSYAIKNDEENTYVAVAVFHFDKKREEDNVQALNQELQSRPVLSAYFKKVFIIYSCAESVMIPFALYSSQENANVLNLIHGDLQSNNSILADMIAGKGIYNVYRMPGSIVNVIRSKFPEAGNIHQHSVLLNQAPAEGEKLLIIFYPKKFVMVLTKNGSTKFINTFFYETAEDVSYTLLNTCKQFDAGNLPVEISGLIEENSALYKEIHKYFATVTFAPLPSGCEYSEEIIKHPSHYFSHIFAVDSCE